MRPLERRERHAVEVLVAAHERAQPRVLELLGAPRRGERARPCPGKSDSARRVTECTSKSVPYASKTSADISWAMGPPRGPMLPLALPGLRRPRSMLSPPARAACALARSRPRWRTRSRWPIAAGEDGRAVPAGGPTDVMTRIALRRSSAHGAGRTRSWWRTSPAPGGTIGSDLVAKSAPDGYTLLMATGSTHSVGPYLRQACPTIRRRTSRRSSTSATRPTSCSCRPTLGVEQRARADRAREEGSGQASTMPRSGIGSVAHLTSEMFAAHGRHQAHARSLQGHAAVDHRPRLGPGRRCSSTT